MDNRTKYKRWAIGALAVLGLVILLAVIIIAGTVGKTPKANQENRTEVATAQDDAAEKKANEEAEKKKAEEEAEARRQAEEQARKEAEEKAAAERQAQEQQAANDATVIPTTGPEDALLPIVLIAVCAYLVALNANWFKNGVKADK